MASGTSLLRAIATLLMGGALAQLIPLALGPLLARLYTPEAFGAFAAFTTVSATVAVLACARYEFALPMARNAEQARWLLLLCVRILGLVGLASIPVAWVLAQLYDLPQPHWLPLGVCAAGLLQLLVMWNNRAERFRTLAISRVVQYGGAAVLQATLGAWLWWQSRSPAGLDQAWALVIGPITACLLACIPLLLHRPEGGWVALCKPLSPSERQHVKQTAHTYRDFPLLNTPHAFLGTLQDALAVALLIAITGQAAAGFWGLALRYLKAPATLVGSAVSQALYPRLTGTTSEAARRAVRHTMLVLGAVAVVLMVILMVVGPWLFVWMFGAQWHEAGELARALAPYIAVHFVAAPMAVVTMAWQAQRWAFHFAIVGQILFVGALALGLHLGGLQGGAWAVSAVMVLYFGYYFYRLAFWPHIPQNVEQG